MKRILALLLAILTWTLPALAEEELRGYSKKDGYVYVTLGVYPQTEDGAERPILWRVLKVDQGKAYLCSEYVLDARRIHGDYDEYANKPTNTKKPGFDGDFTQTELGLCLQNEFLARFTKGELSLVVDDEKWGRFSLLTNEDLKDKALGFGTNASRKAWGTDWAKVDAARGDDLFVYGSKYGHHSPYWLRDQSTSDARHARCTKQDGSVGRINVITVDLGFRPACYLDMSKVIIAGGTGTMEDPYVLQTEAPAPTQAPAAVSTAEPTAAPEAAEAPVELAHYSCVLLVDPAEDPSTWLDFGGVTIVSGSGTAEDPYILAPTED